MQPLITSMKKLFRLLILLSFFLTVINIQVKALSPDQMTDRRILGLKGNVKSITYNNKEKNEKFVFNQNGNISAESVPEQHETKLHLRHYVNNNRYYSGNFYDIKYTSNERKDRVDYPQDEIYKMWKFDAEGRITDFTDWGGNTSSSKTFKYTKNQNFVHKEVYSEGWEDGSIEISKTYTYLEHDNNGNWTKRNVKRIEEESAYDWDLDRWVPSSHKESEYIESAQISYFSDKEASAVVTYFSEEEVTKQPFITEETISQPKTETNTSKGGSNSLNDLLPTWLWVVFAIVGIGVAYFMTLGYRRAYNFLIDEYDWDFLPRKSIRNYITIIIGIAIFSCFFLLEIGTQQQLTITLMILAILIIIATCIVYLKNKSIPQLAKYRSIYFLVSTIVGLLVSIVVTAAIMWAVMIFLVYFVLFKVILRSLLGSSPSTPSRSNEKLSSAYREGGLNGSQNCSNCKYFGANYCRRMNEQVSEYGYCSDFKK